MPRRLNAISQRAREIKQGGAIVVKPALIKLAEENRVDADAASSHERCQPRRVCFQSTCVGVSRNLPSPFISAPNLTASFSKLALDGRAEIRGVASLVVRPYRNTSTSRPSN
jgi:hypothetical protein